MFYFNFDYHPERLFVIFKTHKLAQGTLPNTFEQLLEQSHNKL